MELDRVDGLVLAEYSCDIDVNIFANEGWVRAEGSFCGLEDLSVGLAGDVLDIVVAKELCVGDSQGQSHKCEGSHIIIKL